MPMTKLQLKSIIKECLIEILAEGMGPATGKSISEAAVRKVATPVQQRPTQSVSTVIQQNASKTKFEVAKNLKNTILKEAGGDPIMADILADTAAKTLPTMLENDRKKMVAAPVGAVERAVAAASPEQLFGEEAASKWAALAFAEPTNKLR